MYVHVLTRSWELISWFVWEWRRGVCGVDASVFSSASPRGVCGRWEGGRWWWSGAAFPQSRTVQWVGTKRLDGGPPDWPAPARAPRPAKTRSTAPVQTRELAALFVCLRAGISRLEQYGTSSPPRPHSGTTRTHSKAMQSSLVQEGGIWWRQTSCIRRDWFLLCLEFMLAGVFTTLLWRQGPASPPVCHQSHA